jgi:hypothetical protein
LLDGWPKTHFLPLEVEHDLTIMYTTTIHPTMYTTTIHTPMYTTIHTITMYTTRYPTTTIHTTMYQMMGVVRIWTATQPHYPYVSIVTGWRAITAREPPCVIYT